MCVCVYLWCMNVHIFCVCVWHSCTCLWKFKVDVKNQPPLLFHFIHWDRGYQSNPELPNMASLASQLALRISCAPSHCKVGIINSWHVRPAWLGFQESELWFSRLLSKRALLAPSPLPCPAFSFSLMIYSAYRGSLKCDPRSQEALRHG